MLNEFSYNFHTGTNGADVFFSVFLKSASCMILIFGQNRQYTLLSFAKGVKRNTDFPSFVLQHVRKKRKICLYTLANESIMYNLKGKSRYNDLSIWLKHTVISLNTITFYYFLLIFISEMKKKSTSPFLYFHDQVAHCRGG